MIGKHPYVASISWTPFYMSLFIIKYSKKCHLIISLSSTSILSLPLLSHSSPTYVNHHLLNFCPPHLRREICRTPSPPSLSLLLTLSLFTLSSTTTGRPRSDAIITHRLTTSTGRLLSYSPHLVMSSSLSPFTVSPSSSMVFPIFFAHGLTVAMSSRS